MTTKLEVLEALRNVYDPELGINIVDLGLVYGVEIPPDGLRAHIRLTLTSPGCPLGPQIIRDVKREVQALDNGLEAEVDLVWNPLWHPSMMSDTAKEELGYDPEMEPGRGPG